MKMVLDLISFYVQKVKLDNFHKLTDIADIANITEKWNWGEPRHCPNILVSDKIWSISDIKYMEIWCSRGPKATPVVTKPTKPKVSLKDTRIFLLMPSGAGGCRPGLTPQRL